MIAIASLRLLHPIFQWVLGPSLDGPVGSRDAVAVVARVGVSKPTVIGW
jgi:hypothetical protein